MKYLLIVRVFSHFRDKLASKVTDGALVNGIDKGRNKQSKVIKFIRKPN